MARTKHSMEDGKGDENKKPAAKHKLVKRTAWETVISKNQKKLLDMYARGSTKTKLAQFLGITLKAFIENERRHPEFSEELARARVIALDEVRGAIFKRAVGFKAKRVNKRKIGDKEIVFMEEYEVPPDVTACSMILKNSGEWSDNPVVDEAVAGALSDEERRARACRILGVPDPGFDRSTNADDEDDEDETEGGNA